MSLSNLIKTRRTTRVFNQTKVNINDLKEVLELARLAPSGGNLQPVKFAIITDETLRKKAFPFIKYAGYLKDWDPDFSQSPKAFIALLCNDNLKGKCECDLGISLMTISLLLEEKGLKSCILGAINRQELSKVFEIDSSLYIAYLIGVGYSDSIGNFFDDSNNVKYIKNADDGFSVPKKPLSDILILEK